MTDAGRRMVALTALSYGPSPGGFGAQQIHDEAGHLRATWRASDVVAWARVRRDAYGTPPPALEPCACVLP